METKRYRVLGAPVDAVDMAGALVFVEDYLKNRATPGYILAVNPEKVYVLRQNDFLRRFFEDAALLLADGIGVVKALKLLCGVSITRVPGADLMQNICAASSVEGYKLFVYGASEEVNAGACAELEKRYPGIHIVGRANGYVKPEETPALIERINASGAEILFVAMGSPRQEQWMHDHVGLLTTVKLCQGIGGTLDTITGHVKRAPLLWQTLGLEWFYRLLKQPTRWRRQVVLARFVAEVVAQKFMKHANLF